MITTTSVLITCLRATTPPRADIEDASTSRDCIFSAADDSKSHVGDSNGGGPIQLLVLTPDAAAHTVDDGTTLVGENIQSDDVDQQVDDYNGSAMSRIDVNVMPLMVTDVRLCILATTE